MVGFISVACSRKLPKQSFPQLSTLFLRHTDDVRIDSSVQAAKTSLKKRHLCLTHSLHLS